MFLLDTNIVSELRKIRAGKANPHLAAWVKAVSPLSLFLSVIVIQELETGILLADRRDPAKGAMLRAWLDGQVIPAFAERIIPIDLKVARRSAALNVPNPRPVRDGLIAATALVHGLTVVTRDTADFLTTGVALLDPWTLPASGKTWP